MADALYGDGGFYLGTDVPARHFRTAAHTGGVWAEAMAELARRVDSALGEPDARASITFLGTDRIEVLRFTEGDVVRYATLGMSERPMSDPTAVVADPLRGPRAELVLSVRAGLAERAQASHGKFGLATFAKKK